MGNSIRSAHVWETSPSQDVNEARQMRWFLRQQAARLSRKLTVKALMTVGAELSGAGEMSRTMKSSIIFYAPSSLLLLDSHFANMPLPLQQHERQQRAAEQVLDRRLRPVYDMVDSRNLKGALKLVNTLVQKAGSDQAPIKFHTPPFSPSPLSPTPTLSTIPTPTPSTCPHPPQPRSSPLPSPAQLVKALVLYRMGREAEALEVCGEVREEGRAGQLSERTLMDLMDLMARMGKGGRAACSVV
ncbi:unnamed protein product [Closterium sp. Yama58-4]|nr:unnamed protein product [Closterium sp. Yama58-4]